MQAISTAMTFLEPAKAILSTAASGISDAYPIGKLDILANRKTYRDKKIGGFSVLSWLMKGTQLLVAGDIFSRAWGCATDIPMPLTGRIALGITPFIPAAVGLLLESGVLDRAPHIFTKIAKAVDEHAGKVAKVAALVSCVALIAFGQPLFGAATLVFIIGGVAMESEMIGFRGRLLLRNTLPYVWDAAAIVIGDPISKVIAVCNIAYSIFELCNNWLTQRSDEALAHRIKPLINAEQLTELKNNTLQLHVDPLHLHVPHLIGPEPEFDLGERLHAIRTHHLWQTPLSNDKGWLLALSEGRAENSPEGQQAYIQQGLTLLNHKIVDRQILDNEPNNYRYLRTRAKEVVEMIALLPPASQTRYFAEMALTGYCDDGEEMMIKLTAQHSALRQLPELLLRGNLEEQVNVSLAGLRERLCRDIGNAAIQTLLNPLPARQHTVEAHEREIESARPILKAWLHNHLHTTFELMGEQQPKLDLVKNSTASFKLLIWTSTAQNTVADVTAAYSREAMVAKIKEDIALGRISKPLIDDWFKAWAVRNHVAIGVLHDRSGAYSDAAIALFLTEMGALTLTPAEVEEE